MKTPDKLKQKLFETLKALNSFTESSIDDISFAYDLANAAHKEQTRDSGIPYITHPVEGCILMVKDYCILNPNLYVSFLLHDTGEDSSIFGNQKEFSWDQFKKVLLARVGKIFGSEIAQVILLLTKPKVDNVTFRSKSEVMDYYLKNLASTSPVQNFAVFGKMIDRLHNLRSLVPEDSRKIEKQILETEDLLIPLFESINAQISDSGQGSLHEPDFKQKFNRVLADIKNQINLLKLKRYY